MIFKVTKSINTVSNCDLFYSVPTDEELKKAENIIYDICNKNISKYYSESLKEKAYERLNYEIKQMRVTESAYDFIIVKEIAEISILENYPIVAHGDLSGSIISYLLGITKYDPINLVTENPVLELVWGTISNPVKPNFSIGVSPQIYQIIQKRLDEKYGFADCFSELYKQISLVDVKSCETLGKLSKNTGKYPTIQDFDISVYIRTAKNLVNEYFENDINATLLIEEIEQIEKWDFTLLLRLYAYINGSFEQQSTLNNLNDSDFFVTRDEFFNKLLSYNIPVDIALDVVKKGVWSRREKRQNYLKLLKSYNVPTHIENYFLNTTHLWTLSSCVDRLLHKCYISWYQEKFPEIFEMLKT